MDTFQEIFPPWPSFVHFPWKCILYNFNAKKLTHTLFSYCDWFCFLTFSITLDNLSDLYVDLLAKSCFLYLELVFLYEKLTSCYFFQTVLDSLYQILSYFIVAVVLLNLVKARSGGKPSLSNKLCGLLFLNL